MNYTSIEQSKKLLELGLDANTADMFYSIITSITTDEQIIGRIPMLKWDNMSSLTYIPCWSVGALLKLLPDILIEGKAYCPVLYKANQYVITYQHGNIVFRSLYKMDLIDSLVSMIIWLLENNHIKKEK